MDKLEQWLIIQGIHQYYIPFKEYGIDTVEDIAFINDEDISILEIKPFHLIKMRRDTNEYIFTKSKEDVATVSYDSPHVISITKMLDTVDDFSKTCSNCLKVLDKKVLGKCFECNELKLTKIFYERLARKQLECKHHSNSATPKNETKKESIKQKPKKETKNETKNETPKNETPKNKTPKKESKNESKEAKKPINTSSSIKQKPTEQKPINTSSSIKQKPTEQKTINTSSSIRKTPTEPSKKTQKETKKDKEKEKEKQIKKEKETKKDKDKETKKDKDKETKKPINANVHSIKKKKESPPKSLCRLWKTKGHCTFKDTPRGCKFSHEQEWCNRAS